MGGRYVNRVTLDTNLFWGARRGLLSEIRGRGFRLSLSETALYEALAKAQRDKVAGQFGARAELFRNLLDAERPLVGTRGNFRERLNSPVQIAESLRALWEHVCNCAKPSAEFEGLGAAANQFMDSISLRTLARRLTPDELAELAVKDRSKLESALRKHLRNAPEHNVRKDKSTVANYLIECGLGSLDAGKNDLQDLEQLVCVGEPSFLLTCDRRLIKNAKRSGSPQARWVVSPDAFLEGPLPTRKPWE